MPYTDEQWRDINALGKRIDAELTAGDVRLTQGGEPTFVSRSMTATAPSGTPRPWGQTSGGWPSELLLKRLKARYAPQGLLHYGQGKWYPGEQLPRWSLNAFWRRDGEPLWTDPDLFAAESWVSTARRARARRISWSKWRDAAGRWMRGTCFPRIEDVWYYLWRERRLPANVDPFDSQLEDPLERERLRKVFSQGLDAVIGYVLPVSEALCRRAAGRPAPWFLRDERCYLMPGDSPLGYRIAAGFAALGQRRRLSVGACAGSSRSSFAPLPAYRVLQQRTRDQWHRRREMHQDDAGASGTGDAVAHAGAAAAHCCRSRRRSRRCCSLPRGSRAPPLCAEPRDGRLHMFMPPAATLEDYLELLAAIEATAKSQSSARGARRLRTADATRACRCCVSRRTLV